MSNVDVTEVWKGEANCGAGVRISVQRLAAGAPLNKPIYFKWGTVGSYITRSEAEALHDMLAQAVLAATEAVRSDREQGKAP